MTAVGVGKLTEDKAALSQTLELGRRPRANNRVRRSLPESFVSASLRCTNCIQACEQSLKAVAVELNTKQRRALRGQVQTLAYIDIFWVLAIAAGIMFALS